MDYTHLTFEQRYHIELGSRKGPAREGITRRIGVNHQFWLYTLYDKDTIDDLSAKERA